MQNIVAIIPARGGSKGIIKKNIRLIDGKPLIYYQINAALSSKYISKVYVSTDDNEIKEYVNTLNSVSIINRPEVISGDYSKSEEALIHAVKSIEETGENIDIIVFLQATSPLTKSSYIDHAIEKLFSGYDSIFCAIEDYGFFQNDKDLFTRPMRQEKKPKIRECGNFWAVKKHVLLTENNRLGGKTGYILIDKWDALEIDDPEDFYIVKHLVEHRNRIEKQQYFQKRKTEDSPDYEENYWGKTIDPDGQERNKAEEKEQFIRDTKDIICYVNALKPGSILDVGCGFGFLLSAINNNWNKHGTEISHYAAQTASSFGTINEGDLLNSNYKPLSFDVIILYHVIEHLEDPVSYIKKIHSLLKIGGKLIITTPDFESVLARRYKDKFRLLHDKTHISLFSTESLTTLLKDYGFDIEKTEFPYFETRYFNKENLLRLLDNSTTSPPFYGNVVTIYAYKY